MDIQSDIYTTPELASILGVSLRTIRYYEEEKLIQPVAKGRGPFYDEKVLVDLRSILLMKESGLSIDGIKKIFERMRGPAPQANELTLELRQMLKKSMAVLQQREEKIISMRKQIEALLNHTNGCDSCPEGEKTGKCAGCNKLTALRSIKKLDSI